MATLREFQEGIGEGVLASLRSSELPRMEAVVGILVNELAAIPGELVIVLDDYHVIETRPVHEVVSFLLAQLPTNVHLVISSRIEPPLPLARLRGDGAADGLLLFKQITM